MIEKLLPTILITKETFSRSIVKTITYRAVILILDFVSIYLFTGQIKVAFGFMLVSNMYTTIGYFFYERIWGKIKWGTEICKKQVE
jgi:adenylylsulfate kinase